jgi:hypothetical protein
MNTNAKLALAMAIPAVGMFAGVMMLRGPRARLGGVPQKGEAYTYAFFTQKGTPNRAFRYNFSHSPGSLESLVTDLIAVMQSEIGRRGSSTVTTWEGRLDEQRALHADAKPLFRIHKGGRVERLWAG